MSVIGPQDNVEYEVFLGNTFNAEPTTDSFHTLQYTFKPASAVTIGTLTKAQDEGQLELVLEGENGAESANFKGNYQLSKTECLLIFHPETNSFVIEKLYGSGKNLKYSKTKPSSQTTINGNKEDRVNKKRPLSSVSEDVHLHQEKKPMYSQQPSIQQAIEQIKSESLSSLFNSDAESSSSEDEEQDDVLSQELNTTMDNSTFTAPPATHVEHNSYSASNLYSQSTQQSQQSFQIQQQRNQQMQYNQQQPQQMQQHVFVPQVAQPSVPQISDVKDGQQMGNIPDDDNLFSSDSSSSSSSSSDSSSDSSSSSDSDSDASNKS